MRRISRFQPIDWIDDEERCLDQRIADCSSQTKPTKKQDNKDYEIKTQAFNCNRYSNILFDSYDFHSSDFIVQFFIFFKYYN